MPYVSLVCQRRDIPAIDERTNPAFRREQELQFRCGYVPRDFARDPLASHRCARRVRVPRVPREEWAERIREREATGRTNLAQRQAAGIKCLHQARTSSCWANAVVDDMHQTMARNGTPWIPLSPASLVGPLKDYDDVGGNCSEALRYAAEHGVAAQWLWPPNAPTQRKFHTPEATAEARRHLVLEWEDVAHRDFDELVAILLAGFTCPYGNWSMRHAVNAIDPVIDRRGRVGLLVANSGLYRGPDGYNTFFGEYAVPDDACSVRVIAIDGHAPQPAG